MSRGLEITRDIGLRVGAEDWSDEDTRILLWVARGMHWKEEFDLEARDLAKRVLRDAVPYLNDVALGGLTEEEAVAAERLGD